MVSFWLVLVVTVAGLAQRVSGIGFGLISAPFMAILVGPIAGVDLALLFALLASLVTFAAVWRNVDWKIFAALAVPALAAVYPGALTVSVLPSAALKVGIGGLVLATIAWSVLRRPGGRGRLARSTVVAGLASGFLNSTAALGGPPLVVYQRAVRWRQDAFVATIQPLFLVVSGAALVLRGGFGAVEPRLAAFLAAGLVAGVWGGARVATRLAARTASALTLGLATAGGVAVFTQGLAELLAA